MKEHAASVFLGGMKAMPLSRRTHFPFNIDAAISKCAFE
jgi:hypothetical protein